VKRILIQNEHSRQFLDEHGRWTSNQRRARDFPTTLNAVVHCAQQKLSNVRLLVQFEEDGRSVNEMTLPLHGEDPPVMCRMRYED
jgi:hypothetical protein